MPTSRQGRQSGIFRQAGRCCGLAVVKSLADLGGFVLGGALVDLPQHGEVRLEVVRDGREQVEEVQVGLEQQAALGLHQVAEDHQALVRCEAAGNRQPCRHRREPM